ncbi:helix-turn-helix transcriptional regulator [Achromobacter sp. MYb9]|jgi:DNA-binding CsgD family transcriptional regulator|nr:helix-turn-helix domain-containing protein [Achromobacter sp. MYb9]PQZ61485.1 helix-turn-helix transcriptional regulator [Achromobacter sp. MYb9]
MTALRRLSAYRPLLQASLQAPSTPLSGPLSGSLSTPLSALHPPIAPLTSLSALPAAKALSDRQAACLYWSAAGKTSWETSRILGVSESTVNFHLRNACAKLGVRGRRAAVVAALRQGLLDAVTA